MESDMKILKYASHRNGCSGRSFGVAIFKSEGKTMLGILFGVENPTEAEQHEPHCAVFDLNLLKKDIIEFGENSWRGDHYAPDLRDELLKRWPWGELDAPAWHRTGREREAQDALLGVEA